MICTTYFLTFFSELIPPTGYNKKASGLQGGESVKLHYIDPDGVDQGTVFPME